jgi:hypothetical protein
MNTDSLCLRPGPHTTKGNNRPWDRVDVSKASLDAAIDVKPGTVGATLHAALQHSLEEVPLS